MMPRIIISWIPRLRSAFLPGLRESGSKASRAGVFLFTTLFTLYAIIIPLFIIEKTERKESESFRTKLKELAALSAEYRSLKERIDFVERKSSLFRVNGIPQAMEDISSSLGLRGKVKSMKMIGSREVAGGNEESAEIHMEKMTMNELINTLYKIEAAPMMLSIRTMAMKKTFENPELINVTLTLSLFVKK